MKRAGDVIRDFLVGKTLIFVGDSINSLVYSSFICDAAREGIMPIVRAWPQILPSLSRPSPLLAPHGFGGARLLPAAGEGRPGDSQ